MPELHHSYASWPSRGGGGGGLGGVLLQEAAIFVFWPAPASSIPTDTSSILGGGRRTKDAGRGRATHMQRNEQGGEVRKWEGAEGLRQKSFKRPLAPKCCDPRTKSNKQAEPQGAQGAAAGTGRGSNWGAVVRTRLENSTLCSRQN